MILIPKDLAINVYTIMNAHKIMSKHLHKQHIDAGVKFLDDDIELYEESQRFLENKIKELGEYIWENDCK